MMFNPDIHHRHSIRLRDYDYSQAGAYFVTICAKEKECLFGEVRDGDVILNEYGRLVEAEWKHADVIRENVDLDVFMIMPNHFHGILVIGDVGARRCLAREYGDKTQSDQQRATHRVAPTLHGGTVGSIIGQFKSVVTKQINRLRNTPGAPVWQRNYYEHIIRNEPELNKIREYIINNPLNWLEDENYKI